MLTFKAGGRVRLKDCHPDSRSWKVKGKYFTLSVGCELEIIDASENSRGGNGGYLVRIGNPDPDTQEELPTMFMNTNYLELIPTTHPCTCPRENFMWNGKGCECGGQ